MLQRTRHAARLAALALCTALAPIPAAATLVDLTGNIIGFSGVVGSSGQFTTYFDQHRGQGPEAICPDAGCGTGIGVANLDFNTLYTPQLEFWNTDFGVERTRNSITLQTTPQVDVVLGQEFLLATITYTNGIWFTDPEFQLEFYAGSSDPAFDGHIFSDTLHLTITSNMLTNTPDQNADYLWFVNNQFLGSIRAYELGDSPNGSNSVTVELYAMISSLDPTRLANATGGGFLNPSVLPLPEPVPSTLLAVGVALFGWRRTRVPNRSRAEGERSVSASDA